MISMSSNTLKNSVLALLLLIPLILTGCGNNGGPVLYTLDGQEVRIGDQEGKTLFINFWAEWCAPCRDEIPELNELFHEHGDQLLILAVNADGVSGDELLKQIDRMGIEFPALPGDPRPIWEVRPSGALPETLVIAPDGSLRTVLLGAQTGEDLLALLEDQ